MAYASVEDFILRVGELQAIELTDREQPFTHTVNETVLNIALGDSSSQIDGYLAGRYQLPLDKVPLNLVRICCDLARFRLCSMSNVTITDEVRERYEEALKELALLAKGITALGIEQELENDPTGDMVVMFSNGNTRIFSRDHKNRERIA
ncbi:gp436 family protein [Conservatibacter flavescens]|uniref:DUF1320 domain-containing protein n=1 Tax=Conservatibacter flavescens TaxID=28161 RepID=A0A2M8S506_9PAST|nr:phage protein Gp36 family protein [Conservatibacter flavescens]PJG86213.1 DUF1320 domain-containing protein [Conservatibacter flavescens]